MRNLAILTLIFSPYLSGPIVANDCVLVEAESFKETGGWVVDQQFMDLMGSPYLLAHGLGEPVPDAVTQSRVSDARHLSSVGPHARLGRALESARRTGSISARDRRQSRLPRRSAPKAPNGTGRTAALSK